MLAVAGVLVSLELMPQTTPIHLTVPDLENGKALYLMHCARCHGASGDDISCSGDMTPLAGIGRRPREGLVAQFMSGSFFARGRQFDGDEARDLTAYLLELKGDKGFDDPGFLILPRLVGKKFPVVAHYRIVDIRDEASYAREHIPNAVRWPVPVEAEAPTGEAAGTTRSILGSLGVHPGTAVVIYDETLSPRSALLWWDLMKAGHRSVAILDGGIRRWIEEGYVASRDRISIVPTDYQVKQETDSCLPAVSMTATLLRMGPESHPSSPGTIDWRNTVREGSLRTAEEIHDYLEQCTVRSPGVYRVEGKEEEVAFLIYLLHLLGCREVCFDSGSRLLQISGLPSRTVPTRF